jgi:hypothetical protein
MYLSSGMHQVLKQHARKDVCELQKVGRIWCGGSWMTHCSKHVMTPCALATAALLNQAVALRAGLHGLLLLGRPLHQLCILQFQDTGHSVEIDAAVLGSVQKGLIA